MLYEITIQGELCDLNAYTKACRGNKYAGAKVKKDMQKLISSQIPLHLKNKHLSGVSISIDWYAKDKRKDPDNIAFAKKFIIDSLVDTGVLSGDGWRHIESFTDQFYIDKENPKADIRLDMP